MITRFGLVVILSLGAWSARGDDAIDVGTSKAIGMPQMNIQPDKHINAILVLRGMASLGSGDISAARRLLAGPAAHDALAARLMGLSFDPTWLRKRGVIGDNLADVDEAIDWYRRAVELGFPEDLLLRQP